MNGGVTLDTKELDRILRDSKLKAQQVINKLAFQVERRAKMLAPVDTGALRASIYTNTPGQSRFTGSILGVVKRGAKILDNGQLQLKTGRTKKRGTSYASVLNRQSEELPAAEEGSAIVGSPMSYAAVVEFGSSRGAPAQPYLTPAVQTVVSQFNAGATWQEVCK